MAITGQTKPVQNLQRAFPQELAMNVARSWQQRADRARKTANKTLAGLSDVSHISTPEENEFVQQKVSEVESKLQKMAEDGYTHKDFPDVQSLALEVQNDSDLQRIRQNKEQYDAFKKRIQNTEMPQWRRNQILQAEKERFKSSAESDFTPRTYSSYTDPQQATSDYVDENNIAETQEESYENTVIRNRDGQKVTDVNSGTYERPKLGQEQMESQILSYLSQDEQLHRQLYDDYQLLPEEQKEQYESPQAYATQRMSQLAANEAGRIQSRYYDTYDAGQIQDRLAQEYDQLPSERKQLYRGRQDYINQKIKSGPYERTTINGQEVVRIPKRTSTSTKTTLEPVDTDVNGSSSSSSQGKNVLNELQEFHDWNRTKFTGEAKSTFNRGEEEDLNGAQRLSKLVSSVTKAENDPKLQNYTYRNGNLVYENENGEFEKVEGEEAWQYRQAQNHLSRKQQKLQNTFSRVQNGLRTTAPYISLDADQENPIKVDESKIHAAKGEEKGTLNYIPGGVKNADPWDPIRRSYKEKYKTVEDTVNGIEIRSHTINEDGGFAPSKRYIAYDPNSEEVVQLGTLQGEEINGEKVSSAKELFKNKLHQVGKKQVNKRIEEDLEDTDALFEYTPPIESDASDNLNKFFNQHVSKTETDLEVKPYTRNTELGGENTLDFAAPKAEYDVRGVVQDTEGTIGLHIVQKVGDDERNKGEYIVTSPRIRNYLTSDAYMNHNSFDSMVNDQFSIPPSHPRRNPNPDEQVSINKSQLAARGLSSPYQTTTVPEGSDEPQGEIRQIQNITFEGSPTGQGYKYSYEYNVLGDDGRAVRSGEEEGYSRSASPYSIIYNEIANENFIDYGE